MSENQPVLPEFGPNETIGPDKKPPRQWIEDKFKSMGLEDVSKLEPTETDDPSKIEFHHTNDDGITYYLFCDFYQGGQKFVCLYRQNKEHEADLRSIIYWDTRKWNVVKNDEEWMTFKKWNNPEQ